MPAAMHGNAVKNVCPEEFASVFGALFPLRIIGKRRHHLDIMAGNLGELAQGNVVRSNPNHFGSVVDSPNDQPHGHHLPPDSAP